MKGYIDDLCEYISENQVTLEQIALEFDFQGGPGDPVDPSVKEWDVGKIVIALGALVAEGRVVATLSLLPSNIWVTHYTIKEN